MEDRYLFRAKGDKRYNDGKWYEGYLIKDKDGDFQIFRDSCRITVLPDTICQCTGLKDKNGNLVFENDIMCARLDEKFPDNVTYVRVVWELNGFYIKQNGCAGLSPLEEFDIEHFTVCGNIFDNPELLKINMMYDKKEIDRLGECLSRGFASGFTGVKSYISQKMREYAKQVECDRNEE